MILFNFQKYTFRVEYFCLNCLSFLFVTLPGGFFLKIDGLSFLFVTLPGGFFCKTPNFSTLLESHEDFICSKLSLVSMLELLVLKNLIQRTSQRVKWTSGARDMINSLSLFNPQLRVCDFLEL